MPALTSTKNKTKDLTHGPIGRQLFWFSLPLFAGSLIQQLYSTVDLIFVGRVLGKDAAAAVGASTFIIIIILGFFIGLSVGIGVIAAREFARGEFENLSRVVHCTAYHNIFYCVYHTGHNIYANGFRADEHSARNYALGHCLHPLVYAEPVFHCKL